MARSGCPIHANMKQQPLLTFLAFYSLHNDTTRQQSTQSDSAVYNNDPKIRVRKCHNREQTSFKANRSQVEITNNCHHILTNPAATEEFLPLKAP